jgi:ATP-dependent 26S proteasome regulatory subunit
VTLWKLLFPGFAALSLLGGAAAAQQPQERPQEVEPDDIRETGLPPKSQGGIHTAPVMVGTIVEVDDNGFVLDTATGKETIVLVPQTKMNVELQTGMQVAVEFHRDAHKVIQAALIRLPTAAELEPPDEDAQVQTTQVTTTTTTAEQQQPADVEQTEPGDLAQQPGVVDRDGAARDAYEAAGMERPAPKVTIIGTVEEFDDQQVVVVTSTGTETIQIVPRTKHKIELEEGQTVAIVLDRSDDENVMIARVVREPKRKELEGVGETGPGR